jgi:hypothetical protein
MPEISRFFGIIIYLYNMDHNPPHIHAKYESGEIEIEIKTKKVNSGNVSPRALRLIEEWIDLHEVELLENWEITVSGKQPFKITPLK